MAEAVRCPIEPDTDVPFELEGPAAPFNEEGEAFDAEAEVFDADAVVIEPAPERLKLGRERRRAVCRGEEAKRGASLAVSLSVPLTKRREVGFRGLSVLVCSDWC